MARVMLIDPPGYHGAAIGRVLGSFGTNKANQVWPPYDLQILAGLLKKNRHEFGILDANNLKIGYKEVEKRIKEYSPDYVVYLTCFPSFRLDVRTARAAKNVNPKIKTACVSLSMLSVLEPEEEMQKFPELDFIIWGEPELPLIRLMNGSSPSKIRGLYFRKNGKVKSTGKAGKAKNLDEFGIPEHKSMPYKIYKCPMAARLPMAVIECSRGCVNRCVHCQAGCFQSPIRYRSVENVLEEMQELKKLGIKEIKFWDCALPSSREFVEKLCLEMIKRKYGFSWHCNSRAESIDDELITLMKKAGCHTIAIGCESANNEILKNMGKNETVEEIEKAIKTIKRNKVRAMMYITFGLPGETEITMRETFRFVKKMMPEIAAFGVVVPAPGTPFYDFVLEKGYLSEKKQEFQDPNYLPSFAYPNLTPEKIHGFMKKAYREYYFSPEYILMRMIHLKSATELKILLENAKKVIERYFLERAR